MNTTKRYKKKVKRSAICQDGVWKIPLTKGLFALVDEEDADLDMFLWRAIVRQSHNTQYAATHILSAQTGKYDSPFLHRIVLGRVLQRTLLPIERVDHVNLNGLDNRRGNLRLATHSQNLCNTGKHKNNTSGYKGVHWHNIGKKWRAMVHANGVITDLGLFDDARDAALAYNEAAIRLHGEFARLNIIEKGGAA